LNEYKREAFLMFDQMLAHMREVVVSRLSHLEVHIEEGGRVDAPAPRSRRMTESRVDPATGIPAADASATGTIVNKPKGPADPADPSTWGKVGRNDACPCGSGKKYKHCHGTLV
jgi:preprotein translocase subunit SecA